MRAPRILNLAVVAAAAIAVIHCSADGADGKNGADGVGTPGAAGPSGAMGALGPQGAPAAGVDGGLPTGCLSPCHGFSGIVEQWKTSTHYATYITNLGDDEAASWTTPGSPCGNCHANDAVERRMASEVGTTGGTVTNLLNGELGYKNAGGLLAEATYTGSAKVAQVGCTTCHSVDPTTDPHRTGLAYTPGSFPLRAKTGADDDVFIEKSAVVGTISGTAVGKLGPANACVMCHRSRKDVTNYITASNKITSPNWGPHEGPQTDVYSGQGGYQFTGQTYGQSTHQQKLTCVDCHMPDVAANGGAPNHSFYPQLSACLSCHAGATSFDIDGGQGYVKAALKELEGALDDQGLLTRATAAPYPPLGTARGDGNFDLDKTNPTGTPTLTADQAGALYNFIIVARGGALGVHNPKYAKQLVYDSIVAIKGTTPVSIVRP
ncbi:MAG TPA: hypothetical protein VIF62_09840 [Labilithrix sp.]